MIVRKAELSFRKCIEHDVVMYVGIVAVGRRDRTESPNPFAKRMERSGAQRRGRYG